MKLLMWFTLGYVLLWGGAGSFLWLMDKGWIHKNGCCICERYGEICSCGYAKEKSEKMMKGITYLAENGEDWNWQGILFIILVPITFAGLLTVTHIVNPLHRRKCLADLINPPSETEV